MTQQKSISPAAWGLIFALALIWGGSFLSVRIALDEVGPLTSVLHRTGWAMLILWGYILIRRIHVPFDLRLWSAFFVLGLLNNVIPFCLMAWGQLHIESGLTSILNASTAIFGVAVAALLLRDERLTVRKAIGVAIGFFGVAITMGLENLAKLDLRSLAQLAVLGGTLSYAIAGAWARIALPLSRPEVTAMGMLTMSTLTMVPVVLYYEGVPSLALAPTTWIAISYYAIIATALAYLLYYRVIAMAGSGNTMLITLLVAPIATVLGILVLNEQLRPDAIIGFAFLAIGLLILDGRLIKAIR